ncbi:MAG: DUF1570 domain-containing protein [Gemmataceae bacterium]|nr:DUF1570 domain-containing protein [Gemmataceae bacterium]
MRQEPSNHRSRAAARSCAAVLTLALGIGCQSLKSVTPAKTDIFAPEVAPAWPGKHTQRVSQYVFFADFDLKKEDPLFKELSELRETVVRELQLPPSNVVIQVYLFEDREKYEKFMRARYPDLPKRRAFFVAQPKSVGASDELLVFTFWGDRVRQDLRHELTHAILHSSLKDVPLWLDEGLAEFYELPPDSDGVNIKHLEELRRGPFTPDLARLEQLTQVQQMSPAEYREAWAWTHLMLRGSPTGRQALLAYLQQLRTTPNPGPLNVKLAPGMAQPAEALQTHLRQLSKAAASAQ